MYIYAHRYTYSRVQNIVTIAQIVIYPHHCQCWPSILILCMKKHVIIEFILTKQNFLVYHSCVNKLCRKTTICDYTLGT